MREVKPGVIPLLFAQSRRTGRKLEGKSVLLMARLTSSKEKENQKKKRGFFNIDIL